MPTPFILAPLPRHVTAIVEELAKYLTVYE